MKKLPPTIVKNSSFKVPTKAALKTLQEHRAMWMAKSAIKKVEAYVKKGLPDCYKSFSDYLFDFYPDLPCEENGQRIAIQFLLSNRDARAIVNSVKPKFKFDFARELEHNIRCASVYHTYCKPPKTYKDVYRVYTNEYGEPKK